VKGGSLGTWIWIVGGVITASLLILVAQTTLASLFTQTGHQNTVKDFNSFNSKIDNVCREAPGSRKSADLDVSKVKGIFASDEKMKSPTEAPVYVANSKLSDGKYVCMSFEDEHHGCVKHGCTVNMTWLGMPQEGSDAYVIGEESGFNYEVTISKQRNGNVRAEGKIVP
jgi:hypothetical protein